MSKLTNLMDKACNFSKTPEGVAVLSGASNMMQLGLSALLVKKLFPSRATFGAAIAVGIIGITSTAAAGYSAVIQERFKNGFDKDLEIDNLRASFERMKSRINQLTEMLDSKNVSERSLENCKNEIETLKAQLETLQKENQKLSGKFSSVQEILREELPEPPAEIYMPV